MKVILINGYKRSGKDFVANYLVNKYNAKKLSYAYYIKKIISTIFGISMEDLDRYKNNGNTLYEGNDEVEITFRKILQIFGTEAMKPIFGDNVWANLTHNKIIDFNTSNSSQNLFVIADFRFLIEYKDAIEKFGMNKVVTIRIKDKNIINKDFHPSETELLDAHFKFDYYIDNTEKSLKVFDSINEIMKEINI